MVIIALTDSIVKSVPSIALRWTDLAILSIRLSFPPNYENN